MVAGVIIATNALLTGCQIFPTPADDTISQRVHPLLRLADAHIGRGDLTAALPLIIQAEQIAPAATTVALERAEILARQGDQAEAQRIFGRLGRQEPEVSHAYARFFPRSANQRGRLESLRWLVMRLITHIVSRPYNYGRN